MAARRDDANDDVNTDAPSRSHLKREARAVFELARRLVAASPAELARLPLSAEIRELAVASRAVTQQIARKRQLQYLAKQLRRREQELPALRAALAQDEARRRRASALLHRAERWRARLIDEGDTALDALLAEHPTLERQWLRQLARRAREQREQGRPPAAARELLRRLREALDEGGET